MLNTKKETFTREELKEALKKFKMSRDDVQDPEVSRLWKYNFSTKIETIHMLESLLNINMNIKYSHIFHCSAHMNIK